MWSNHALRMEHSVPYRQTHRGALEELRRCYNARRRMGYGMNTAGAQGEYNARSLEVCTNKCRL